MNAKDTAKTATRIIVGKIGGHFGIKGWLKIVSFTRPIDQIFQYDTWLLGTDIDSQNWLETEVLSFKASSRSLIAKFSDFDNREASNSLIGCYIGIDKSQLEMLATGEYYWLDLIGLKVVNLEDIVLGTIHHLLETGANDVLVVKSILTVGSESAVTNVERLLPWTDAVVLSVDLENKLMTVDWKEDYLI